MAKPAIGYQYWIAALLLTIPAIDPAKAERSLFRGTLFDTYVPPMAEVERIYGIKKDRLQLGVRKSAVQRKHSRKARWLSLGPLRRNAQSRPKPNPVRSTKPVRQTSQEILRDPVITGSAKKPTVPVAKMADDKKSPKQESPKKTDNGFDLEASLAGSIGYDTNIDEENDAKGSLFHRYDAKLSANYDADGVEVEANGEISLIETVKADSFSEWKLAGDISAKRDLGNGRSGGFGFSYENDSSDIDDSTSENKAFSEFAIKRSFASFELRGDISYEIDGSGDSSNDNEDDPESNDELLESGITATVRYKPDSAISPFLRLGLTDIHYTRQENDTLNRNALATTVLLGLRYKVDEQFRIDLATRFDQRHLDALGIASVNNFAADVNFEWKPTDALLINGAVEQKIDNPGSSEATYAESTKFELEATWSLNELIKLELSTEFERTEEPEVDEKENELTLEAKIARKLNDRLSIFSALDQKWYTKEEDGEVTEKYKRTQIRAGIEVKL